MVAIIAMILPGISGGFIFIIFGVYEYIIKTINDFTNKVIEFDFKSLDDILYKLIIIILGIITGLKLFSKILKWLIENHEKKTLSILMGIMIGSLPEIWPLKTYDSMINNYNLFNSILFIFIGFLMLALLEIKSKKIIMKRSKKDFFLLILKGIAMGTANKIPGVSGGIVALASGFYEELIFTFKKFDGKALKLFFSGKILKFLYYINFKFLFFLFSGVIFSFFTASLVLDYFLIKYEKNVWGLFFGMILGSIYSIKSMISDINLKKISLILIGFIVGYMISLIEPGVEKNSLIFILICGVLSISGMTLPGFSGSYLLILAGNYKLIMVDSVNNLLECIISVFKLNFDFFNDPEKIYMLKILLTFTSGSILGLLTFSNILSYLLKNYKESIICLLIGFIIGSLNIAWPWNYINAEFKMNYSYFYENFITIFLIFVGLTFVIFIELYARKK